MLPRAVASRLARGCNARGGLRPGWVEWGEARSDKFSSSSDLGGLWVGWDEAGRGKRQGLGSNLLNLQGHLSQTPCMGICTSAKRV